MVMNYDFDTEDKQGKRLELDIQVSNVQLVKLFLDVFSQDTVSTTCGTIKAVWAEDAVGNEHVNFLAEQELYYLVQSACPGDRKFSIKICDAQPICGEIDLK